jgi:hypothetical protein
MNVRNEGAKRILCRCCPSRGEVIDANSAIIAPGCGGDVGIGIAVPSDIGRCSNSDTAKHLLMMNNAPS